LQCCAGNKIARGDNALADRQLRITLDRRRFLTVVGATGAEVVVLRGDVGRRDDVARVLDELRATMPPLVGVVHAAGVNDDAVLTDLLGSRRVSPRTQGRRGIGARQGLPPATPGLFVLVSWRRYRDGRSGRANYAAANAFLDSFTAARHPRPDALASAGAVGGVG
jgi:polyketide synthase 12/myxalamid-type polyketide synthase MxaB